MSERDDQSIAVHEADVPSSPTKPFKFLNGLINERALLRHFKAQRERKEPPSGAFLNALKDIEWLPGDQNPTRPQLAPFLSIEEIKQLTQSIVFEIPLGQLPQHKNGPKHRLTKAEVAERKDAILDFLKKNGAKPLEVEDFEEHGMTPSPAVLELALSKRYEREAKYIGRRRLPLTHPLHGHKVPLVLHAHVPDHKPEPNYPYTGHLLLNSGEVDPNTGNSWGKWTGFNRKDIEAMPNNTDAGLTVQLHEIGHIAQKESIRVYSTHSLETNYRIEHNADTYSLEAYRRLGASRGDIELMLATAFVRTGMNLPKNNTMSFYQNYWFSMALLHGRNGVEKWPLYRSTAAALELYYLGAAYLFKEAKPYNSRLFNGLMKEALLGLHERPPKKVDPTIDYGHVEAAFNAVAGNQHLSPKEMETVKTFNDFARARAELRTAKYKSSRHLGLLAAYRELWNSTFPLNDDALLVLGLTLEAAALFRPSLRTQTLLPEIFTDPQKAIIKPRKQRVARLS